MAHKQVNDCHQPEPKASPASCCNAGDGKTRIDILFWGSLLGVSLLYLLGVFFSEAISALPWLATMAATVQHMLHLTWWGVVIGAVFIALLSKVPREFIIALLGRGGTFRGLLRATGAGVLLDLCNHGILMVASKLYERGASAGQVIAFLLASPWNSFSLTLILIGLIGLPWTAVFVALSMLIALVTGWLFDRLVARGTLPPNDNAVDLPEGFQFWSELKARFQSTSFNAQFFKEMILSGIKDSRIVVRWLLFGILLAAVFRVVLQPEQFEAFFGPTILGLMVTVAVATVLEVCSEGSTPIAADLFARARAPGNSFAFLMAGAATDYTEIMVLKDTTKSWRIALFLPLLTLPQILLLAWLMNWLAL